MAYQDKDPSQNVIRNDKALPSPKDLGLEKPSPAGFWNQEDVEASAQDEIDPNFSGPFPGKSRAQK